MRTGEAYWILVIWGLLASFSFSCAGCAEKHLFSAKQLPTKNLYFYRTADLSQYLERQRHTVYDLFDHIATNSSGTAVFVVDSSALKEHTTYVLSEERDELGVVTCPGPQSVLDDKLQTIAWMDPGPFCGGPARFVSGYKLPIDNPEFTQCGYDPSGHYFWMDVGPGVQQYTWDPDHADDLIQIRDTREPGQVLFSTRARFVVLQLFSHNEKLYLFGKRHRHESLADDDYVCLVIGRDGEGWAMQRELRIPFAAWDYAKCWGIDPGSDFALLSESKYFVPIPYVTIDWHLLDLKTGTMIKLDFLDAHGSSSSGTEVDAMVPLFLKRDFLGERLQNVGRAEPSSLGTSR